MIVELRQSLNGSDYFVKVFFKNSTAGEKIEFRPMTIHGCDELCPLARFLEIVNDKTVEDFSSVCRKSPVIPFNGRTLVLAIGFVALIGVLVAVVSVVLCRRRRAGEDEISYQRQQLWRNERIGLSDERASRNNYFVIDNDDVSETSSFIWT